MTDDTTEDESGEESPTQSLTVGMDVDIDALANELHRLADNITRANTPLIRATTAETAKAEDATVQTLMIRYLVTNPSQRVKLDYEDIGSANGE